MFDRNLVRGAAPLAGLVALSMSGTAFAGPCQVATDPDNQTEVGIAHPSTDIKSIALETADDKLTVAVEFYGDAQNTIQSSIRTILTSSTGAQYWVGVISDVGPAETAVSYRYGTYGLNPDTGFNTYFAGGDAVGSLNGPVASVTVPLAALDSISGPIQVESRSAQTFGILLATVDSAEGVYTIGDSCGKAQDYYGANYEANQSLKSAENTSAQQQMAAAGSFGWLMILAGLIGLRRSR